MVARDATESVYGASEEPKEMAPPPARPRTPFPPVSGSRRVRTADLASRRPRPEGAEQRVASSRLTMPGPVSGCGARSS